VLYSDPNREMLQTILSKKEYFLNYFKNATVSGFTNLELISMANEVNKYWKDLLRPTLTSLCCEAVGGKPLATDEASVAVSLLVAGMGIHDDIIDKSPRKHFRRTILGTHGQDEALLAGDLLIIKGLLSAQDHFLKAFSPEKRDEAIEVIRSFLFEIYDGELLDISCRKNLNTNLEDYNKIIDKLAADAWACAKLGGIIGGGSDIEVSALGEYGRVLGSISILSSEVRDILNEDFALLHRLENESLPLAVLHASKTSNEAFHKIQRILSQRSFRGQIVDIQNLCLHAKSIGYIQRLANEMAIKAETNLQSIQSCTAKASLLLMLNVPLTYISNASEIEKKG
jgi:geranylgeranyl diphosphate synthase, type I